ncbi:hypothetical protein C1886_08590 [Pseudomonas sp. FW300-N1A1]|uniref:hypothetical protein n=1 Tax=Pseudomonas sp. FW300-N1A1 TaxID=2075555 RepID=UPI000CD0A2CA|nr:hypothetical protein [Pseudomonas sp. FW300-N1A1]POA20450.1 hypothetical protein C1886_08590 [Pseudomonas sp. FW300-N1A1]
MSSNRQKSFLATLSFYGKPVGISLHRGNTAPVWGQKNTGTADMLYFRCTDDWYTLYIRSEGDHYGKTIDRIGSFFTCSTTPDTTTFKIVSKERKTLTLDDLKTDNENIYLLTRSGLRINAEYVFGDEPQRIIADGQVNITFDLNILERNAPYLSNPDEV